MESFTHGDQVVVLLATAFVVPLVVGMHYEAMRLLAQVARRMLRLRRLTILIVILGLIIAHLLEIVVFALAYIVLVAGGYGGLTGLPGSSEPGASDYFYFSAVVYSTVGFGDLAPLGPMWLMAGVEALVGLMLVAWSAAFAYLQMHKHWRDAFLEGEGM